MDWSIWLFFSFFFGSYISTRIFPLYNKTKASKHMSSQHRTWRWVMNPKVWPKWAMIWRSGAALPRDAGWNLADFFLGLKFASPSKLFLGGCYPDIHDISNFQAWNEILVDEYEIFLDASHFRIPLIWCNICIPVQSSSKKDPKRFKFLVFFIQIRRVSRNFLAAGTESCEAARDPMMDCRGRSGRKGCCNCEIQTTPARSNESFFFKTSAITSLWHPEKEKSERLMGRNVFFWNIDSRKWQVWWSWEILKKLRNLQHKHPVLVENFAKSLKASSLLSDFAHLVVVFFLGGCLWAPGDQLAHLEAEFRWC